MNDPVLCPWCGAEMRLAARHKANVAMTWCECRECKARSSLVDNQHGLSWPVEIKEAALVRAAKRYREPRKPVSPHDVKWLGMPYIAEYKGVDELFLFVTGNGIKADFAAARKLGWEGKTLGELFEWEDERGKLQCRLWEFRYDGPLTDEERAKTKWEE